MQTDKNIGKTKQNKAEKSYRVHRKDSFVCRDKEIMKSLNDFKTWYDMYTLTFPRDIEE